MDFSNDRKRNWTLAKRLIRNIPLWTLSALAAGSISASVSDRNGAGLQAQTVLAPKNNVFLAAQRYRTSPTNPISRAVDGGVGYSKVKVIRFRPAGGHLGKNRQQAILIDKGVEMLNPMAGQIIATTLIPLETIKTGKAPPALLPAEFPEQNASAIVDVPQLGSAQALSGTTASATDTVPTFASGRAAATMQPANGQAIYGTSARNAFKVYFPQAKREPHGNANHGSKIMAKAPAEDSRILTKGGSYFFYEDAPADAAADRIKASLTGSGDSKAVLDAIVAAKKDDETKELTSPVLQKQQMNFGDRPLESHAWSDSKSNGGSNDGH